MFQNASDVSGLSIQILRSILQRQIIFCRCHRSAALGNDKRSGCDAGTKRLINAETRFLEFLLQDSSGQVKAPNDALGAKLLRIAQTITAKRLQLVVLHRLMAAVWHGIGTVHSWQRHGPITTDCQLQGQLPPTSLCGATALVISGRGSNEDVQGG